MKTFIADVICVLFFPFKAVLLLLLPFLLTAGAFYVVPLLGHYKGEEWLFINDNFVNVVAGILAVSAAFLLLFYLRLCKSEANFSGFVSPRELRACLLATAMLIAFIGMRFVQDREAQNFEIIGRPLAQVNHEIQHFVSNPLAHFNGGEKCAECSAFAEAEELKKEVEAFLPVDSEQSLLLE